MKEFTFFFGSSCFEYFTIMFTPSWNTLDPNRPESPPGNFNEDSQLHTMEVSTGKSLSGSLQKPRENQGEEWYRSQQKRLETVDCGQVQHEG